jgi:GTP-binding protein HflX
VWNKIDMADLQPGVERDEHDKISRVFISARSGAGLDLLREAIVEAAAMGANPAPGLRPTKNEEQDDAALEFLDEEPGESNPTSTHVGPQ